MRTCLMFLAGGLAGLALAGYLGLGSRILSGRDDPSAAGSGSGSERGAEERLRSRKGGESRPSSWVGTGRGLLGSSEQATAFIEYLTHLSRVERIEETNLMELVRHAGLVARMSEREVSALLIGMRERAEGEARITGVLDPAFEAILFCRLAELNGPEAMRRVLAGKIGVRGESGGVNLLALGMSAWVAADPERAEIWFREAIESEDVRKRFLVSDEAVQLAFYSALARVDGRRARELALVGAGHVRHGAGALARSVKSIDGLKRLLGATTGVAQIEVMGEFCRRDLVRAVEWIEENGEPGSHDELVASVAEWKLLEDPVAGANWYMRQRVARGFRAQRLAEIVHRWAESDIEAASHWLAHQPNTPARDLAEAELAILLATDHRDWKGGFAWVAQVGNPSAKNEVLRGMFTQGWDWQERTPEPQMEAAAVEAGFSVELLDFLRTQQAAE